MGNTVEEKRAVAALLLSWQPIIYNLYIDCGLSVSEVQRELVWELKLGWVR